MFLFWIFSLNLHLLQELLRQDALESIRYLPAPRVRPSFALPSTPVETLSWAAGVTTEILWDQRNSSSHSLKEIPSPEIMLGFQKL